MPEISAAGLDAGARAMGRAAGQKFGADFVSSPSAPIWLEYARAAVTAYLEVAVPSDDNERTS